ncbi:MAG: hypothetical protein QXF59_03775 [Candidatus Bathyarchaeia archaeon]
MVYSEEVDVLGAKVRIDVYSSEKVEYIFEDNIWFDYRLGKSEIKRPSTKNTPDIIWYKDTKLKNLIYNPVSETLTLFGDWFSGELQRLTVALLLKELEKKDIFSFHATGFSYKGLNIMLLSGESNHGKTMTLIEALRRGALMISGETILIDWDGNILAGSKEIFLKKRPKGTERSDLPSGEGWRKFFDKLPEVKLKDYEGKGEKFNLVVLPDIDGHFDTEVKELSEFEKQYQTFVSITAGYYMLPCLISSEIPMPLIDSHERRIRRAQFVKRFSEDKNYYVVRGRDPKIVMDCIEEIIS